MTGRQIPPQLQRTARAAARALGRATAGARMDPSFLIVGAQRCGTTSMYKMLTRHPAVLPAVLHKGVHYFDTGYDHGISWYRGHFPLRRTARRVERVTGVLPVTGESSPYYMFHPLAAQRISAAYPDIKLIVLLRDPVERAYSAHTHETARGYEDQPFEHAVDLEPSRLDGEVERMLADPGYQSHHHQHNAYLARGRYVEQLEQLEKVLGRDRIHVVDSHQFFDAPEPTYDAILAHLGLPRWQYPPFGRHNARPRLDMAPSLRARLDEYFLPFDERLAGWLGETPSWRR
jgi:hypothetical protein